MNVSKQCEVSQRLVTLISLMLFLFVFCVISHCMNPDVYKPDGPPDKTDPPGPPILLLPEADEEIHSRASCWVPFDWTDVEGAQSYEMQLDTTSNLGYSYAYEAYPGTPVHLHFYPPMTTYFFRVRAYSSAWIWYTEWSETRRFFLLPSSGDTIFPPE